MDRQGCVVHDDPVDDQPEHLLLDGEGRFRQGVAYAGAERVEPLLEPPVLLLVGPLLLELAETLPEEPPVVVDPLPAVLQLG
jgi:hypothetical protein